MGTRMIQKEIKKEKEKTILTITIGGMLYIPPKKRKRIRRF